MLPAASVTLTVSVLLPGEMGTETRQVLNAVAVEASTPLTLTLCNALESLAVPRTVSVAASVYDTGVGKTMVPVGGVRSTRQVADAGEASVSPAAVARTRIVCELSANPVSCSGVVAASQPALSRLYSKVAPATVALSVNDAEVELVSDAGPPEIVVSGAIGGGGAVSVQVNDAGVASTFPAASMARVRNVCEPFASPSTESGNVAGTNATLSTLISNVAFTSPRAIAENVAGWVVIVVFGVTVSCVSGGVVSTTQVRVAGVASMLPAASRARTSKVCEPSVTLVRACGLVAAANAAASTRLSNVELVSLEVKVNEAEAEFVRDAGAAEIVVSGAVVSGGGGGGGGGLPPLPPPPPPQALNRRAAHEKSAQARARVNWMYIDCLPLAGEFELFRRPSVRAGS